MPLLPSFRQGITFGYGDEDLPVNDLSDDEDADTEVSLGTDDTENVSDNFASGALEGIKTIKVENSYMEEKEQAVIALKDVCQYTAAAFVPYLDEAVAQTKRTAHMPDDDVKQASYDALVEFAVAYYKLGNAEKLHELIVYLVKELALAIKGEEEVMVVCRALENLARLHKECKDKVSGVPGHPEQVIKCIHWVMNQECACQDSDQYDADADEEEEDSEQDEVLFEYAGEVLPALGMAMTPQTFAPYFAGIMPHLLKKAKKQCSESERSFAAGALAECMRPLGDAAVLRAFLPKLLPVFVGLTRDHDDDVRNNAIYGLGEMALHGGDAVFESYPSILQTLSAQLGHEENARVIDQIVSAVCRLVLANRALVPLAEVLPVVFQHLPLKEDFEEYHMVFRCLQELLGAGEAIVIENATKILHLCATIYDTKAGKESEETGPAIVQLVKSFAAVPEAAAAAAQLPEEAQAKINSIAAM